VAVEYCGICHSDLKWIEGTHPLRMDPPIIFGHEIAGRIVEAKAGFQRGQRVMVNPVLTCGKCVACLEGNENLCSASKTVGGDSPGGFAEYVKAPIGNIIPLPDAITAKHGAFMCDIFFLALHAVNRAEIQMGDVVAIFGVGAIGILTLQLASSLRGARVVAVDLNPGKLELAGELGAALVINPSREDPVKKIREFTDGLGADRVMEVVGLPIVQDQAIQSVRPGGRVLVIGLSSERISAPTRRFFREEIEMIGVFAFRKKDVPQAVKLILNRAINLDQLPTETVALDDIHRGIELSKEKKGNLVKVFVKVN